MKKFIIFTSILLIFAFTVWLFVERVSHNTPGMQPAPKIEAVSTGDTDITLSDLKGKYVLVNFWDSHNAVSRIAAGEYDRFFRAHRQKNLRLLSVNTDNNRRLFDEIVRSDGLDSLTQFHIMDIKARGITPDYHPEDGYSSYLLNPSGKVIAVNPTIETVEHIVNN